VGLTILPPSCAECLKIWKPPLHGTLMGSPGLFRDCFTLTNITMQKLRNIILDFMRNLSIPEHFPD
jgi:hypothetical protein